jgi:hypothetical protein
MFTNSWWLIFCVACLANQDSLLALPLLQCLDIRGHGPVAKSVSINLIGCAKHIDSVNQSWINLFADDSRSNGRYEKRAHQNISRPGVPSVWRFKMFLAKGEGKSNARRKRAEACWGGPENHRQMLSFTRNLESRRLGRGPLYGPRACPAGAKELRVSTLGNPQNKAVRPEALGRVALGDRSQG